ncbi:hypothetical protein GALMADRAFT_141947 [Galerina marginata CBS 339.88]|uniref:Uncharacterized protein n=1 Tax=Galerina marginata (strain CBS 339.88) TaxID=685588 RepID=A0A067T392_GALM3|nr:hypothetical protein GALMADRAFT_141947 [Galerina marginata CBS 339.88]
MASDNTASFPRRNSLRIPPQPPQIPMPPSLQKSPYLNASMFKREASTPGLPSEEDEKWLQDTVPISATTSAFAEGARSCSAKARLDRRGSIIQPSSRHSARPPSGPPSPCSDSALSSPSSTATTMRLQSRSRYLAHSLAPQPEAPLGWPLADSRRICLNQTHSEPNIQSLSVSSSPDTGYFPRLPPMR